MHEDRRPVVLIRLRVANDQARCCIAFVEQNLADNGFTFAPLGESNALT
jgi:hypothetical protein